MKTAVVIPTYNRATLVGEAIRSTQQQTSPPEIILVVDDGSTDNTATVITEISQAAPSSLPVVYCHQENAHLSAARNTGFAHLPPEIEAVLFLDDDDRLLPDALARLTDALAHAPTAPLAYGRPHYIAADGGISDRTWSLEDFEGPVYDLLTARNFICTAGCVLLRRTALEAVGTWDTTLRSAEDWDMWLRLSESGAPFARVTRPEKPTLEYRLSATSMSHNYARMREEENRVCRKHRDHAPAGSPRRETWDTVVAEREARIAEAARHNISPEEALLTPRHRLLRRALETTGIASLYRRIPLRTRLYFRQLLGINRRA